MRLDAFEQYVSPGPNGCLVWAGRVNDQGYGMYGRLRAHRVAFERASGPIPNGMCVCHHCDNPPCVNPEHLFLGTHADNTKDKVAKGRHYRPSGELNGRNRLTQSDVDEIRALRGKVLRRDLATRFGVCEMHISYIHAGRTWKTPRVLGEGKANG